MNELMFQVLALILSMLLGVATIYSIRIYLELWWKKTALPEQIR